MAGSDDIVQNIVLAGQAEVIAGFAAISAAGVAAFDAIQRSATATSIGGVAAGFLEITGAVASATAGMFAFVQASAQSTATIQRLATTEGVTLEVMSGFVGALSATGASVDGLTAAFKRFAVQVSLQFPTVSKEVRNASNQMVGDLLRVEQSQVSLASAVIKSSFQQREATQTRQQDIKSLAQAQLGLAEATEKRIALETGQPIPPGLQVELNFQKALLEEEQARLNVQEALKKKQEDAALAPIKALQAQLDVAEKAQQAETARLKFLEDQGSNILNLKKFIDDTAAGIRTDSSGLILSEQNIVRGLIASVGPAVNSVTQIQGAIGDFGASAPKMFPTLLKLADLFKNLGDETTKQAVAVALFGRGFNVSLIESLSLGSGAIQKIADKFKDLGFILTSVQEKGKDSDEFLEKNFRQTFGLLAAEVNIVSKQFANLFSPLFTPIIAALSGVIEQNRETIINWGKSIVDFALPAVEGLIHLLTGKILGGVTLTPEQIVKTAEWELTFSKIGETISKWAKLVIDFLMVSIPAAFKFVLGVLDTLASGINKVFGTKVTGEELGFGILLGQLTGINNIVLTLIANVPLLALSFLAAFGPGGAIALAVIALAATLAVFWTNMDKDSTETNQKIRATWSAKPLIDSEFLFGKKGGRSAWQDFIDVVNKDKAGASNWEIFVDTAKAVFQFDPLKAVIEEVRKRMDLSDIAKKDEEALGLVDGGWSAIQKTADGAKASQVDANVKAIEKAKELESQLKKTKDAAEDAAKSGAKIGGAVAGAAGAAQAGLIPKGFQGLVEGSKAAADAVGTNMSGMVIKIEAAASQIGGPLQGAAKVITSVTGTMADGFKAAGEAATGMAIKIGTVDKFTGRSTTQAFIDVKRFTDAMKKELESVGSFQPTIGGPKVLNLEKMLADMKKLNEEAARINQLRAARPGAFESMETSVVDIIEKLKQLEKETEKEQEDLGKGPKAATGAFDQFDEDFNKMLEDIKKAPDEITGATSGLKKDFGDVSQAAEEVGRKGSVSVDTLKTALDAAAAPSQTVAKGLQDAASTAPSQQQIATAYQTLASQMSALSGSTPTVMTALTSGANAASTAVTNFVSSAMSALDRLIEKLKQAGTSFSNLKAGSATATDVLSGGPGPEPTVFGFGGLVRGKPGRDQNLAWLSDYEYVLRPEATLSIINRYGRSFLDILNATGKIPGFSAGGLVRGLSNTLAAGMKLGIPAYAAGGLVGGGDQGRRVTVTLRAGNKVVGSMSATESVADNLARLASHARIVAAGKSPDWYS